MKYKEKYVTVLCNVAPVMTSFLNVMNVHHNELGTCTQETIVYIFRLEYTFHPLKPYLEASPLHDFKRLSFS